MGVEWYDMIARRNGGYRGRAAFTVEGQSAEALFEQRLLRMLPDFKSILDAGCGHGAFTLRMAGHARHIVGFDNSVEMIRIAKQLLRDSAVPNVAFVHATTKTELPFTDGQFDLIYDRRGPTSILNHSRVLARGGTIVGIHNAIESVQERLRQNGFRHVKIETYGEAVYHFPNERELALFLSDTPGNPDYTLPENEHLLREKLDEHRIDGRLAVREERYIWTAVKP
ncbi:class I SAM-dependent methyltransferase [Paenibacillus sp. IB182496]|uniref:Class I SAM-dependent methyltransferase n=1 Tax=Paenibacillus sabuli TaxID=2772509 RepID=A0A927BN63_9BACL|nr:class I SAM-dependent methyltransferase [Paenibacillus sabuli]MBD2843596.1 class I SAM-dependent methyltransferase [Paenibacillus sabuli]